MNPSYFHPPTVPPKSRKREWMFFFIIVVFGVFGLVILLVRRKRMSGGGMSTSSSDACKQAQSLKRKCCHFDEIFTIGWTRSCHFDNRNAVTITKFSLLAALEVVNLTACNVASDKNFIKMTFLFHWYRFCHIDGLVQNGHDDECHLGPLFKAWISNYIHYKVWAQIPDPYPNFNSATHTLLGMWVFIHAATEVNLC